MRFRVRYIALMLALCATVLADAQPRLAVNFSGFGLGCEDAIMLLTKKTKKYIIRIY